MTSISQFNDNNEDNQCCPQDIILGLQRPVVLVGLMGAGKTSVGRALARILDLPFIDVDHEIEAVSRLSVSDIFRLYGEEEFRALERRVISRILSDHTSVIVATGGGAFINQDTRDLIRDKGHSLWLRADLDILEGRTKGRSHRPLLNVPNIREKLQELMDIRYPIYESADMIVDTLDEGPSVTAAHVLETLRAHLTTLLPENQDQ